MTNVQTDSDWERLIAPPGLGEWLIVNLGRFVCAAVVVAILPAVAIVGFGLWWLAAAFLAAVIASVLPPATLYLLVLNAAARRGSRRMKRVRATLASPVLAAGWIVLAVAWGLPVGGGLAAFAGAAALLMACVVVLPGEPRVRSGSST